MNLVVNFSPIHPVKHFFGVYKLFAAVVFLVLQLRYSQIFDTCDGLYRKFASEIGRAAFVRSEENVLSVLSAVRPGDGTS